MLKPPFVKWPELQISKSKMEKEMDEFIVKETKFTVFSFTVGQTESRRSDKIFHYKEKSSSKDFVKVMILLSSFFRLYNKDAVGYINPFL